MKTIKLTRIIFLIGFIFWIGETWYFGWNMHAINEAEKTCDSIVSLIFAIGLFILFRPAFKAYEEYLKTLD
jgi:hypothetical protein